MDTLPDKDEQRDLSNPAIWMLPAAAVLLLWLSRGNFLLFHSLTEWFTILIAISSAVVVWNTYPFSRNDYLLFIAIGYFWVGILDFMHTMAYEGMNIFPAAGANESAQLWIATRFLEALILLLSPLFLTVALRSRLFFALTAVGAIAFYALIMSGHFPAGYIAPRGLTSFKVISEYVIIAMLVAAVIHLWRRRELLDRRVRNFISVSIILTMIAEVCFTQYIGVYDLANALGHIIKMFSFWMIYQAIILTTLRTPFRVLSRHAGGFYSAPDANVVIDNDARILYLNRAALSLTGGTPDDIIGKRLHTVFHRDGAEHDCRICRLLAAAPAMEGVEYHDRAGGHWYDYSSAGISDPCNRTTGKVVTIRDISEKKSYESALGEVNTIINLSPAVVFLWHNTPTLPVSFVSDNVIQFGYTPNNFYQNPELFSRIIHPEDAGLLSHELARHSRQTDSNIFALEFRIITRDRRIRWLDSRNWIRRDTDGAIRHFHGIVIDITARRETEQALRDSENHIRHLLDSTGEGIFGIDRDGICTFANASCLKLLGFSHQGEVQGRNMYHLVHHGNDPQRPGSYPAILAARNGLPIHRDRETMYRRDGSSFVAEYRAHPLYNDGRITGAVVTFNDIGERIHNEEELERHREHLEKMVAERTRDLELARDQALQATRAKSEFLANMSHELRTPLDSIMGFSEVIRGELDESLHREQLTRLDIIHNSAAHLLELLNDILDLSRIESNRTVIALEPFDIALVIRELTTLFQPQLEKKGLRIDSDLDALPAAVRSDRTKVRQILLNLLGNAVKFTDRGRITVRGRCAGGHIVIEVSDTGIGIAAEHHATIFTPFSQVQEAGERRHPGTGLGLTISRRFAELLGGSLEVSSAAGRGSTFTLRIRDGSPPACDDAAGAAPANGTERQALETTAES